MAPRWLLEKADGGEGFPVEAWNTVSQFLSTMSEDVGEATGLEGWQIALIVIGCVILLALLVVCCFCKGVKCLFKLVGCIVCCKPCRGKA